MPERDLIALVRDLLPHEGFLVGPGDDAAVLEAGRIAWSTDLAIEGVHFDLAISSVADAARKALNRNLSDMAAMGARPLAFLLGVGLPSSLVDSVEALARGLAVVCAEHELRMAGGDLSQAPQLLFAISILGEVDEPIRRDRAQVGDLVAVTGALGEASAGLAVARSSDMDALARRYPGLLERHRLGCARVRAGIALSGLVHAAIDVSDGLALDLERMADASGVAIELDLAAIPEGSGVRQVAERTGINHALVGGDDYELAIALAPQSLEAAVAAVHPLALTVIGRCAQGAGLTDTSGATVRGGHEHLT